MNLQSMMAQAQRMQRDITQKKQQIDETDFEGTSEWVKVKFKGDRKLVSLKITKEGTIDEDDKDVLEDMISIAISDAFAKIDKEINDKLGAYSQGLNGLF